MRSDCQCAFLKFCHLPSDIFQQSPVHPRLTTPQHLPPMGYLNPTAVYSSIGLTRLISSRVPLKIQRTRELHPIHHRTNPKIETAPHVAPNKNKTLASQHPEMDTSLNEESVAFQVHEQARFLSPHSQPNKLSIEKTVAICVPCVSHLPHSPKSACSLQQVAVILNETDPLRVPDV